MAAGTPPTVRLDDDLERFFQDVAERTGRTRSDVVREALRRELTLMTFEKLRQ